MTGNAAPGQGCEAAGGDTSSAATLGRRDGGGMRLGGAGTGAEAGNWGRLRGCSRSSGGGGFGRLLRSTIGAGAGAGRRRQLAIGIPPTRLLAADTATATAQRQVGCAVRTASRVPPPPGYTTSYKEN
jgi:hypothetical protein